ncbi:glycosyltransferase [uncultured Desulfobacter sp.]|uniref:glycosyltransferase n=1 Tax=uncultured Desulfobacter sp. TaxID=240139 RepID=UPI0029F4678D|nr:glycosyltransferase [uncultured Desulfobacter sp.]
MKKKMRLALFLNTVSFGGVEKHVAEIAIGMNPKRFEVFLICPLELAPHFHLTSEDRYTIFPVKQIEGLSYRPFMDFITLLRNLKPDILHCHLYNATRVGAPAAVLSGVPAVIETGHLVERWRSGFKKVIPNGIDMLISNLVDQMVAVSTPVAEYFINEKRYPVQKVSTIHNWCDLNSFSHRGVSAQNISKLKNELRLPGEATILGIIGRLEEQKGHRYLFKVLPDLIRRFPNTHILVIGQGSLECFLRKKANQDQIQNNVHFLGFREDIPELMALLDILLLPSLFEGMPLTLIEGAAMGIPSIATNVDGSSDVIQNGESGFLIPVADTGTLKSCIEKLIISPELRKTMSIAAMKFAKKHFDMRRQLQKLENLYEAVLARKIEKK